MTYPRPFREAVSRRDIEPAIEPITALDISKTGVDYGVKLIQARKREIFALPNRGLVAEDRQVA